MTHLRAILAMAVLIAKPAAPTERTAGEIVVRAPRGNDPKQAEFMGPLRQSRNPNYFQDSEVIRSFFAVRIRGTHFKIRGTNGTVRPLDFDAFVAFLQAHGHNFTLLWTTELPRFRSLPSTESSPPDFTVSPFPWARTGPGSATDGQPRFDLTRFDQAYFDRLRNRVQKLQHAGIYAGVYLFSGEFLLRFRFAGDGYPFSGPNNVNGIDDGYRGGSAASAVTSVTMTAASPITEFQDGYVKKVIDTLNDLPNVLWIVSEEAPINSTWWNDHLISVVRAYEKGKLPAPHRLRHARTTARSHSLQLGCRLGRAVGLGLSHTVMRNRQASVQSEHQRQRPQLLRYVERFDAEKPQLRVGELLDR